MLTVTQEAIHPPVPYEVLDVRTGNGNVFVLMHPDAYLLDPNYKKQRNEGMPAFKNLWAFDASGRKLWEAEMPEPNDYYYEITSTMPLRVLSFSSYEVEIIDGRIEHMTFLK